MIFLLTLFLSSKENDKKIVNNQKNDSLNIDFAKIKKLIKLQKNANYIDYRPANPYLPIEKDLLILVPFVEQELKKKIGIVI